MTRSIDDLPEDFGAAVHARLAVLAARSVLAVQPEHHEDAGSAVSNALLWRQIHRAPGAPVDLAFHRAVRGDAAIAARYIRMLNACAAAQSPVALAASTGEATIRKIGDFELKIAPAAPDRPAMVVLSAGRADLAFPHRMDLVGPLDGKTELISLDLAAPIRNHIVMPLAGKHDDPALVLRLIQSPTTSIWLF